MPDEPSISGANVVLSRAAIGDLIGAAVFARALDKLPREIATPYVNATSVGWVPVRIIDTVTKAAAAESGWAAEKIVRESARIGVESLLKGLWRVMLRFTTDAALVSRTPMLYAKTYSVGRLDSVIPRPGQADVTQSGWKEIPDLQVVGLAAGVETVLRCAGRDDVKMTWKRSTTGVSLTAVWRV